MDKIFERNPGFWDKAIAGVRDAALEALSPTRCASCERPGALICERCLHAMQLIDPVQSCTRCGAPFGSLLCTECQCGAEGETCTSGEMAADDGTGGMRGRGGSEEARPIDRCIATAVFEGPPARTIRAYKDAGERRLGRLIAEMLFDTARHAEEAAPDRYAGLLTSADGIVFVPATAQAYRRRGFDHMELLASELSDVSGIPLVDALVKHGRSDQRLLGRAGRVASAGAGGVYEVVADVEGRRLLLIDDVITTGATLQAAASELKRAGAVHVDALAFARVWG